MAFLVRQSTAELDSVRLAWRPDRLLADVSGEHFEVERQAGQGVVSVLHELESRLREAGWAWLACENCLWYWTTGASLSQGQGAVGYCAIVGVRHRQALVTADHACGCWTSLTSASHDEAQVRAEREEALRVARPDRRNEVVGCGVGMGAATELCRQRRNESTQTIYLSMTTSTLLAEFRRIAEFLPMGIEQDRAPVVDAFQRTLVAEHRNLATLDAALILGVAGWRRPFESLWSLLSDLAVAAIVDPRTTANAGLLVRWTQMAMSKQPSSAIQGSIAELIQGPCQSAHDDWAPWIDLASHPAGGPPADQPARLPSERDDDPTAVAVAWFAWQQAGTLLRSSCQLAVDLGGPLAGLLAGALSGTMNGQNHVRSQIEPAMGDLLSEWTRVGEELWGQMPATARGDRPR